MQYFGGSLYFVHNGCLYKNDTVIIPSGNVNDAFVSSRGIYYLSENKYIALYKTPFYCIVDNVKKLTYYHNNWFAAYNNNCVYIIRPNCTVFKKYRFQKPIHTAWMVYDYKLSWLYLFISCGNHLYAINGLTKQHFYCTDTIIYGNTYTLCHTTGFYIRSYFSKQQNSYASPSLSDCVSDCMVYDTTQVYNIITGYPIQKAFYLHPKHIPIVPNYEFAVIFPSGSDLYLLVTHSHGKAYTFKIASSVDDWTVGISDSSQYILYIRRDEYITSCNLTYELSYIMYADPDKKIPHYPPVHIQLDFQTTSTIAIRQTSLIHSGILTMKRVIQNIPQILYKLLLMFFWWLIGVIIVRIIFTIFKLLS